MQPSCSPAVFPTTWTVPLGSLFGSICSRVFHTLKPVVLLVPSSVIQSLEAFLMYSRVGRRHYCGAPRTWQPTSFGTTCTTLRTWVLTSLDTSQRLRSRRWFSLRRQKKKLAEFFFDGTDVQIIETKAWITHYGHRLPC